MSTHLLRIENRGSDNRSDDDVDVDEDLTPFNDGDANGPYIWAIDSPSAGPPNVPVQQPDARSLARQRNNFIETAYYAGVKVSSDLPWYWRSSQENLGEANPFAQNNGIIGDNRIESSATTPLTFTLGGPVISFTANAFTPNTGNNAQDNVAATITGTGLNAGGACQPVIYLIREFPRQDFKGTRTQILEMRNIQVAADGQTIAGNFDFRPVSDLGSPPPAHSFFGAYTLKVFIGETVRTIPNAITITRA